MLAFGFGCMWPRLAAAGAAGSGYLMSSFLYAHDLKNIHNYPAKAYMYLYIQLLMVQYNV